MDPANNRLEVERIAVLLRYGTWGGLVAHILFLLLFLVLGSYLLAAFNILSIGIFAICIMLAMRGKIIATILPCRCRDNRSCLPGDLGVRLEQWFSLLPHHADDAFRL